MVRVKVRESLASPESAHSLYLSIIIIIVMASLGHKWSLKLIQRLSSIYWRILPLSIDGVNYTVSQNR